MNVNHEVMLVVDQDQRFNEAREKGKKIDPELEVEAINNLMKVLGSRVNRYALVSEHDERGVRAYHRAGFEVTLVDGNRPIEVNHFVSKHSETLKGGHVGNLVMVTSDPTLLLLATHADTRATNVSVWATGTNIDRELGLPAYSIRDLDEMLPGSPKVIVMVDYENIHYGIQKQGGQPDPNVLVGAIKAAIGELGEIKKITAYADWEPLGKATQRNIQRDLVQLDVETCYLINMRGKNTADMRVANDIRDLVERGIGNRDEVDVIVLVTGDRDFRDIVKTAQERGKKVVIVALRKGLSHDLETLADEVKYLDDYIRVAPKTNEQKHRIRPWNENALLVLKAELRLGARARTWLPLGEFLSALELESQGTGLRRLQDAGLVIRTDEAGTNGQTIQAVRINNDRPLVQAVTRLMEWVPDRIAYCLQQKGMPWVDSAFLAKGMAMDKNFQDWGIGQERTEAEVWLDLLASVGLIVKRIQPHPKTPSHLITTWWLPDAQASKNDLAAQEHCSPLSQDANPEGTQNAIPPTPAEVTSGSLSPMENHVDGWALVGSPA
jgi:hypothetical protein